MEVSRYPLTPDGRRAGGRRGQRQGFLLTHLSRSAQEAHSSAGGQASGVKSFSVIVALALKFGSHFCRLFGATAERCRRAGKHLDVQSLSSCFDGVTCVIHKPKQLFNELGDCKQMVVYTKLAPPVSARLCEKVI